VSALGDYDNGEIGGMIGRGNRSNRRKPAPVPLCPPQTPHAARMRTRAAAVGSQRLTAELRHGLNRLRTKATGFSSFFSYFDPLLIQPLLFAKFMKFLDIMMPTTAVLRIYGPVLLNS
jgi:hypothetical protein